MSEKEIFEEIIQLPKWYAGLRTDRGNYHSASSANRMVRRYRKGSLSDFKIKQIFNKHGWVKPEVEWMKTS